ncbi:unnamed protein product [Rotaria socialis]|uniref:ABC transmembrane type-1 domain-containing protein n=2 Tax=Rotaria socialis TaxID=392032 RepID=A0A818LUX0_9BILA|nr:unnamed protein product [Rotaria socialis]
MEKIDDDQDDPIKMQKAKEEEEEAIGMSERSRLISDSQVIVDVQKHTAFAIAGSQLTQRIRSKAFGCFLRQEVAYFDRSENTSGAISVRLSFDAVAVQEMAGTRLGVIFESLALTFFGIAFSCFMNWQLTFIVLIPIIAMALLTFGEVSLRVWQGKQNDPIMGQASTLAVKVIHNMRTIKQLSVEKEILRQYSDLIYEAVRLYRMTAIPVSIAGGLYWTIDVYTVAFVYWRALILVEEKQLTSHHIIMVVAYSMFALPAVKLIGML